MRFKWITATVMCLSLMTPAISWADEIDDLMSEIEGSEEETSTDLGDASLEILPEIGDSDQLAVFVLDRGFYFSSDVGVLINLGGVKKYSNVQPFITTTVGYDIKEYISGQAYLSQGYVSQNPLAEEDRYGTADYSLTNMGAEVVGAWRPTPRFAMEGSFGAGLTRLNPLVANYGAWAPHVVGGVDFKYLTLLTDFTAGIALNGYMVLNPQILAISTAAVVRYTF